MCHQIFCLMGSMMYFISDVVIAKAVLVRNPGEGGDKRF
jgi:hypothetical protein